MFVQCSKRFENLYHTISIRAFQKPMSEYAHQILKYKIPNLRLHLRLRLRGPKFFHLRLWLRPKKSLLVDHCSQPNWFDMDRVRKGGRLIDVYSHGSKRPICQNVSCEKLTIYSLEPIHEVHTHSTFPNNIH